jgi:predicted glutamine amidotransferase
MALVIGKDKDKLNTFELAFKSAWARTNQDGVGIYWRDSEKGERHLARFEKSNDVAKVPQDYDRLLIHFRKSTKGDGTHPFRCRDRPDLGSGNWLLLHNGVVEDEAARRSLAKADEKKGLKSHEFSTLIDSEPFVHIWGELEETDLLERAKAFTKVVRGLDLNGWANLIFYNVVTDEYVVFAENAMVIAQNKKRDVIVFCSDGVWLNWVKNHDLGAETFDVEQGTVIYGKGLKFKAKKGVWQVKPRQNEIVTYYYPPGTVDNAAGPKVRSLGGGMYGVMGPVEAESLESDHYFTPARNISPESGEYNCKICGQGLEAHELDSEDRHLFASGKGQTFHIDFRNKILGKGKKNKGKGMVSVRQTNNQTFKVVGSGYIRLRLFPGDLCRPQSDGTSTGICQKHYDEGFTSFIHEPDGWYLVKSLYVDKKKPSAPNSGIPKSDEEDDDDDTGLDEDDGDEE